MMVSTHVFKAEVEWQFDDSIVRKDRKSHQISLEGKPVLDVSAAKVFKGNTDLYNPEDLLLSSLMSCHLMSYLYVCEKNNIQVLHYSDAVEGKLEVQNDGSGRFVEVRLFPKVKIANPDQKELAIALHEKAGKLCFIANSCNFTIRYFPSCEVL